jgi:type IV pilus assembly protein PilE
MQGMSLIELMIVVAIVAILGTIATNSYRGYVMRTHRTEARSALLRVQAAQEKFFLQNNRYALNTELSTAPPNGLGIPAKSTPGGYYNISIARPNTTQYMVTATATGGQLQDVANCQTLSIDNNGGRTPPDSSGCWK